MIGMILCGHGNFATGVYSAIQLILGEQEHFATVDFVAEMSSEELNRQLVKKIDEIETGSGTVIFTDIPGGTPFNQAVLIFTKNESVKVLSGTNLPLLLESAFKRELSLNEFVLEALKFGVEGLKTFEPRAVQSVNEDMIGI